MLLLQDLLQVHALSEHASCRKKHAREGYGNLSTGMAVDTAPVQKCNSN